MAIVTWLQGSTFLRPYLELPRLGLFHRVLHEARYPSFGNLGIRFLQSDSCGLKLFAARSLHNHFQLTAVFVYRLQLLAEGSQVCAREIASHTREVLDMALIELRIDVTFENFPAEISPDLCFVD